MTLVLGLELKKKTCNLNGYRILNIAKSKYNSLGKYILSCVINEN